MRGSSPDVGSSRISSSASEASAATNPTFWRLPFEYVRALLRRVELETLEQLVAAVHVEIAAQATEQVDHLAAGELRPQAELAGHVRQAAVQLDRVVPRITAEQLDVPRVGAQQPEEHANRRRLARAVRAEEPVDLAGLDRQIQPVERARRSERLHQTGHADRGSHAPHPRRSRPDPMTGRDSARKREHDGRMPNERKFIAVMPGAEPFSAGGGPHGALVLHGFTGTPQSMRGLAAAFAGAGFAVELPLLPGHGTSVDDLATTTFADWSDAAERAYADLAGRCERVVVAGLSMGATLATWLATRHPEIAGLVVINGAFAPPEPNVREALEQLVAQGVERIPGLGNDVADPSQTELAYSEVPPAQLLSLLGELDTLRDALANVHCPALVITSDQDHVVEPVSSDVFAERVAGPVERMRLVRSFHVATLDYERADVEARAVEFAGRVVG